MPRAASEFLLFSGTGEMLHNFDFENCALVNLIEAVLVSAWSSLDLARHPLDLARHPLEDMTVS